MLVVWGKYDRFISSKLGYEIAERLPNAKLEIIDKAGHYVHMDQPYELVQVVTRFLSEEAQPQAGTTRLPEDYGIKEYA